jgi:hypothetical protein
VKLDLIIPYLLTVPANTKSLPHCALLETWLARASQKPAEQNYFAQLFSLFGLPADVSPAWLSALADNCSQPERCWRADPVHFQAGTDHAILLDNHRLAVQQAEADQLAESFNRHFAEEGLMLITPQPHRWYVQFKSDMRLTSTPLHQAIGRNVRHFLPQGEHGLQWRKWLNEAQMLFYTHPVNQQREAQGKLTINALWLWGEGMNAVATKSLLSEIFAEEVIAQGVAKLGNHFCQSVKDWSPRAGHSVLILDDLIAPASYGDADAWVEKFQAMCQHGLPRLHQALREGKISRLTLYPVDGRCFELHRNDLHKFWRWRKPLKHWMRYDS